MSYTGFKNVTFKTSDYSPSGTKFYKGRTICYEGGRRLWQKTSPISRLSRGDALRDAQNLARDAILENSI